MATTTTALKLGCAPAELGGNTPRIVEYILDITDADASLIGDIVQMLDGIHDLVVITGGYEILTPFDTNVDIKVGKGTGTELHTTINADGAAGTKGVFTNTVPVLFDDDTVDASIATANATVGEIRFWFLVVDATRNVGGTE